MDSVLETWNLKGWRDSRSSEQELNHRDEGRKRPRPTHEVVPFEEAFGPLANHLFPDGCPATKVPNNLEIIWPQPKSRAVVSEKEALAAMKQLQRRGRHVGFSTAQQEAVIMVACATLRTSSTSEEDQQYVVKNTSLRGGTSHHFRALVRSTVPIRNQPVSSFAVMKLLSSPHNNVMDSLGTICVLQFLTLAVRNGALAGEGRQVLSSLYGIVFPWVMDPYLCADAVRLLHAITRKQHVRVYRAQRLRDFYTACSPDQKFNFSPLWLLLQLYAKYDPQGCGKFFFAASSSSSRIRQDMKAYSRCFTIPDLVWERNYTSIWHKEEKEDNPSEGTISKINNQEIITSQKRHKTSSAVLETLNRLGDSFEGVHSFSSRFDPDQKRSLVASDLLSDTSLSHLMIVTDESLCRDNPSTLFIPEVARLRVCLPFMLQEEWYQSSSSVKASKGRVNILADPDSGSDDSDSMSNNNSDSGDEEDMEGTRSENEQEYESTPLSSQGSKLQPSSTRRRSRIRILEALASMTNHNDKVTPEAESLLLNDILRSWDGTDEWGRVLCYDLLPYISAFGTISELRNKLLTPLEKLFLYGSPKLQISIVSGTFSTLLRQLAMQYRDSESPQKRKLLKELIHWTDDLLLKGFLADQSGPSELLSLAAIDFFRVVCMDVPRCCAFLILPSTSLVYQLLLSQSPLAIDCICQLLVDYKTSFQMLKQRQDQSGENAGSPVEGLDR
jgi:hypothetical protein